MKVRELVAELAKYDADVEVVLWYGAVVAPIEAVHFSNPPHGGDGKVYLMGEQDEEG